jgi:hypothetical protein
MIVQLLCSVIGGHDWKREVVAGRIVLTCRFCGKVVVK